MDGSDAGRAAGLLRQANSNFARPMPDDVYFRLLGDMGRLTNLRKGRRCACGSPVDMTGETADLLCLDCFRARPHPSGEVVVIGLADFLPDGL